MDIGNPNHVSSDKRKNGTAEAENDERLARLSLDPPRRRREDIGGLLKDGNVGGAVAEGLLRLFDK